MPPVLIHTPPQIDQTSAMLGILLSGNMSANCKNQLLWLATLMWPALLLIVTQRIRKMYMKLSRYEQETIVNYNAGEQTATVYNAAWIADTFGLEPIDTGLAGKYGIQPQAKGGIPCLRFMPGFTRGEGLFLAVFRRSGDTSGCRNNLKAKKKGTKERREKTDQRIMSAAKSWIKDDFDIISHEGRLLAVSGATASLLDAIPKGVRIISAGTEIGEIKGKDLIPAHALAMSTAMADTFPKVELSREDALQYLAKESIQLPEGTPRGYVAATYQGFTLGFLKNLGNRSNNLYPSEYRIRDKKFNH